MSKIFERSIKKEKEKEKEKQHSVLMERGEKF